MTKIRITIYSIIFIFLLAGLSICIFSLTKNNNKNTSETSEITPSPLIEITWAEAVDLVQNCQIKSVFQKHDLTVTLTDKNNQVFKTLEPNIDDIFNETNHLRSDCNDTIQTITE
ncbi:MAG: hypothetical protein PHO75_00660 [Candidatus Shapirobacteria bacterium]|nr:hypothetical protein [Candidatus Shapirobacteria bacterium]